MSNTSNHRPHILVFPFPAQGHLIPMLDLTHQLATRNFSLTIIITPKLRPLLDPFLTSTTSFSIDTLILPLPPHPSLPPGVEHIRDLPSPTLVAALMQSLSNLHPSILAWAQSHPNPPIALLSEFFLGNTHHLAADLNIPRIAFYSSSAALAALMDRLFHDLPTHDAFSFPYAHLPSLYRRYISNAGDPDWKFTRAAMLTNAASWGAVFNTFDALEHASLKGFAHPRVWAVGPIPPAGRSTAMAADLAAWLDKSPPRSVIYVGFGSQFWPTVDQARALASALDLSKARFVWAVGRDEAAGGVGAVVPEGFEERVAGRGVVVRGWAPQTKVLGHEAVGAFLSHCGWNSVLEGIAAGVMMMAWPMEADQFVNARLLVDEAGVAVRVCEGAGAVPEAAALARDLAAAVEVGTWREVRERAVEMGRRAREAVDEGGSSFNDLEAMVKELREMTQM